MKRPLSLGLGLLVLSATISVADEIETTQLQANLDGIHEVDGPSTVITNGTGTFTATMNNDSIITFALTYRNLSSPVTQAHIHIGEELWEAMLTK